MSQPIISVEGLSKAYRLGLKEQIPDTLASAIAGAVKAPVRKFRQLRRLNTYNQATTADGADAVDTLWALRDVSFEVQEGEVLGVIGRNGAGKSTLLKILSRITEPTRGRATLRGRVSSLLEVGTGFHPELTGRDNVYLNGTILGMTKREVDAKFDAIVDFSGVEKFLDTPIKRYSSGMTVRLAFAVAAHLEPEILIIDEVLAVGDAEFQKKCMGKMQDVARGGRTVLFVSHNLAAVQSLCTRAILMKGGRLIQNGSTDGCLQIYVAADSTSSNNGVVELGDHPARHSGNIPLIESVTLLDEHGNKSSRFLTGAPMTIRFRIQNTDKLHGLPLEIGAGIEDSYGARVFSVATYLSKSGAQRRAHDGDYDCRIDSVPLAPGNYRLSVSAGSTQNNQMDVMWNSVPFDVDGCDFYGNGRMPTPHAGRVVVRSEWGSASSNVK